MAAAELLARMLCRAEQRHGLAQLRNAPWMLVNPSLL
jgi:hypothetical protein